MGEPNQPNAAGKNSSDLAPVPVEVEGSLTGIELGQVGPPGGSDPRPCHEEAEEHSPQWTSLPVSHERSDGDEARNELGPVGSGENCCTGAHGAADDSGGASELLHESDDVARRLYVAVAGEARVALAVAAQVGPHHPEAGVNDRGDNKPVGMGASGRATFDLRAGTTGAGIFRTAGTGQVM
jgi:hypothetical protein